jgi:hypothetical protein
MHCNGLCRSSWSSLFVGVTRWVRLCCRFCCRICCHPRLWVGLIFAVGDASGEVEVGIGGVQVVLCGDEGRVSAPFCHNVIREGRCPIGGAACAHVVKQPGPCLHVRPREDALEAAPQVYAGVAQLWNHEYLTLGRSLEKPLQNLSQRGLRGYEPHRMPLVPCGLGAAHRHCAFVPVNICPPQKPNLARAPQAREAREFACVGWAPSSHAARATSGDWSRLHHDLATIH